MDENKLKEFLNQFDESDSPRPVDEWAKLEARVTSDKKSFLFPWLKVATGGAFAFVIALSVMNFNSTSTPIASDEELFDYIDGSYSYMEEADNPSIDPIYEEIGL